MAILPPCRPLRHDCDSAIADVLARFFRGLVLPVTFCDRLVSDPGQALGHAATMARVGRHARLSEKKHSVSVLEVGIGDSVIGWDGSTEVVVGP